MKIIRKMLIFIIVIILVEISFWETARIARSMRG